MFRFEQLDIWKMSIEILDELLVRGASLSISNNIAEGAGCQSNAEFIKFSGYSRRSAFEVVNMLTIFCKLEQLCKMISGFVRTLRSTLRYRFLLFAGIFPYILGAVVSYHHTGEFVLFYFLVGLAGISLVLMGVEVFNEYFDFKIGGDRVFLAHRRQKNPRHYLKIGIIAFSLAFFIAVYLSLMRGIPIMIFAITGALSALFYVAPPISFSYRGLGEIIIFLNYGPFITMGSYYLQAQKIDFIVVAASLVPGFIILSLSLINEIPDYYGDKLVGKKNIVVRLGRKKTLTLYGIVLFLGFLTSLIFILYRTNTTLYSLCSSPIAFRSWPYALCSLLFAFLLYKNFSIAKEHYETPKSFIPAIRGTIFLYTTIMSLFIISFV